MLNYNYQRFLFDDTIISADIKYFNEKFFIVLANETKDKCKKEINIVYYEPQTGQVTYDQTVSLIDEKARDNNEIIIKMNMNTKDETFYFTYKGIIYCYYVEDNSYNFQEISKKYYFSDLQVMGDESKLITKSSHNDVYVFDLEAQIELFSLKDYDVKDIRPISENKGIFGISCRDEQKANIKLYDVRESKYVCSVKHSFQINKFAFSNSQPYVAICDDVMVDKISIYDYRHPDKIYRNCENQSFQDLAWIFQDKYNSWDNLLCYSSKTDKLFMNYGILNDKCSFTDVTPPSEKKSSFKYLSNINNKMVLGVFGKQLYIYDFGNSYRRMNNEIYLY